MKARGAQMRRQAWVAGVATLLLATSCSPQPQPEPQPTSSSSPTTTETAPAPSVTTSEPPVGEPMDENSPEPPSEQAVWDDASRAGAIAAAEAALGAFAQPSLSAEQWWTGLSPFLSATAKDLYAYVDPAAIPVTALTGPGVSVDEFTPAIARIEIPTDAGTYTVVLSREGADPEGWLVEQLLPPEQP